jgi:outer membrane protein assembly factor BamB
MTTEDLIRVLESRGLLPPELIRELRDRAAKTPDLSPRRLVRSLVKSGHLSAFQGQELLAKGGEASRGSGGGKVDDLEVIDDLEEIPASGPAYPPSLPPLGASNPGLPGGLDALMQSAGLGPTMMSGGALGAPAGPKKKPPASVWETKLILIGGGSLAILLLMSVALFFLINRGTAEEALALAEKEYADGRYTQAVALYDQYLAQFPDHPKVSIARVHRGMSLMRRSVDGAKGQGWVRALEESKEILDATLPEQAISEARAEIATMLQHIAEGLAELAEAQTDATAVALARETVEMVRDPKYVPAKNRDEQLLLRVEARLARVDRDLDRGRRLQEAVDAIKQAVEKGTVRRAYDIRKALLRDYPDMAANTELQEAIQLASQKEQELVKFVAEGHTAETKDVERPIKTTLLPTTTLNASPPGMAGQVICALAEGAAYALDAATGKVLWRRFVGYDTLVPPTRVGQAGGDLLLIDSQNGELLRLAAATGELRWRLALPGLKVSPVVLGNRVLVPGGAAEKGRLNLVDLESGRSTGYVELPQPLRCPPTADSDGKWIFQVSEHSNLYMLDAATHACKLVVYLGHEPGAIVAPPVLAGDYVIVAENRQAKVSWVRVLKREETEEGEQTIRPLQEVRVDGHVTGAPLVMGRNLIVATDLGGVFMFDISPSNPKEPLIKGPLKTASLSKRRNTYVHMRGSRLWLGNTQLGSYDVQLAGGQLLARWVTDEGSEFLQPFQTAGDVIFHVRAQTGKPGIVVTAAQMDERNKYWETRLAAPPAAGALLDPKRGEISVLLADGSLFQTPLAELARPQGLSADNPSITVDPAPSPASQPIALAESRWAFVAADQPSQVLAYAPGDAGPILRWVKLPDLAGGLPAALAGKLVVPGAAGVVFSFDPFEGRLGPAPFLSSVDGGREFQWRTSRSRADQAGVDAADLLLFDGRPKRSRFFRIGLQNEPSEHLAALGQIETAQQLDSLIARTEKTAYAVNGSGELVAFELPSLKQKWSRKLFGQVAWGPQAIGQRVLLLVEPQPHDEVHLTDGEVLEVQPITAQLPEKPRPDEKLLVQLLDPPPPAAADAAGKTASAKKGTTEKIVKKTPIKKERTLPPGARLLAWKDISRLKRFDEIVADTGAHRLVCLDDVAEGPVWSAAWKHGPVAGAPLPNKDGGYLVAALGGVVVHLNAEGKEIATTDLRQPLASGPVAVDERQIAIAGRDGTLHVLAAP